MFKLGRLVFKKVITGSVDSIITDLLYHAVHWYLTISCATPKLKITVGFEPPSVLAVMGGQSREPIVIVVNHCQVQAPPDIVIFFDA